MNSKNKATKIILNLIPIVLMIALIPFVVNDYLLTGIYVVIIAISLFIRHEKGDFLFLILGFVIMMISEYFFISTGVERFVRNSLFGLMPLWLPFLWADVFVVIKRVIVILRR
jgi:hypothetical protein